MRRSRLSVMFLFASMVAVAAHAQGTPPAVQVVDLKAGGGVTLKATYGPTADPNAEARPSPFDLEHAWPFYSYIIVSVKDRQAGDLTCWTMLDDRSQFVPEELVVE